MSPVAHVIYLALLVYGWLLVLRALLSWFPLSRGSALFRLQAVLYRLTEPYLQLFRRLLPPGRIGAVGIDWSFLLGLLVLFVAVEVVARL
jgi:YggT family protein